MHAIVAARRRAAGLNAASAAFSTDTEQQAATEESPGSGGTPEETTSSREQVDSEQQQQQQQQQQQPALLGGVASGHGDDGQGRHLPASLQQRLRSLDPAALFLEAQEEALQAQRVQLQAQQAALMGAVQPHAPGVTMQALQAQQLPPPLQQQQAAQAQERGQAVQGQAQGTPTALRFASSEGVSQEALQALVDEVHHIVAALHQMGLRSKADIHALQGLADAALEQSTFGSTNQDHCARCHKPAGLQVLVPQACVHWPPDTPDTLHSVASTAPTALVCLRNVERRGITLQQAAGWRRAPLPAALGPLPTPVFLNMHRRCPLPLTGQRGDRGRAALLHRPTVPCACRERHGRRRAEAGVPVKSTTASSRTPAACWMPAGAWRPLSRLPKLRSRAWRTSATACQRCEHTKGVGTGTPCSQCLTQAQLIATVARLDPVRLEATAQSISVKVPPATGRKQHEAAEEYREREAKRRHQLGKNIVEGALKFKTKYPSTLNLTNAQARLCLLVWQLRQRQDLEWWVDPLMVGLMDRWRTSLLLLGKEGTGSGFHVDPANAFNIALAIDRDLGGVLAYWVFVRPTAKARDAVQAWLNLSKKEGGVGNKGDLYEGKPMLNEQEMMAMEAHFQGTGFIKVIRREAGGLVRVPTGWIHLVFNKQPCVKVAWEVVVASNLALYLHNWRHIGTAPPPTSTVS